MTKQYTFIINKFYFRCAETENHVEFDDDDAATRGRVIEGEDVGGVFSQANTLPEGLTQQQLAVEAFTYVDSHSDSNFRGYLAGHNVHSILVSGNHFRHNLKPGVRREPVAQ